MFPSPKSLEKIQEKNDQQMFDKVTEKINAELKEQYIKGKSVDGTISKQLINERVVERIKMALLGSGWISDFQSHSDSRDGNYYSYSIKADPTSKLG